MMQAGSPGAVSLAARYRAIVAESQARTDRAERHRPGGAAAFRAFAAATLPRYEVSADDPDLPSELLPDDWPGDQLAAAIGRAFRVFVPLMVDYLGTLTSGKRLPGG
jgi:DNA-binding transcriptional regulator PaaX